jgi:predicted RNA-binding Zn-ribbon protein involved in translation (DUF1610 family)
VGLNVGKEEPVPVPPDMISNDFRASVIAMLVRNAIEDIHANPEVGLTDDVMAEMNPLIRRAIWEALEILDDPDTHRTALAFTAMAIPEYWETASTLPPLGNLSLAGKEPPRFVQAYAPRQVSVRVTVPTRGRSYFTCPNCGDQIKFDNKYPYGWSWKVCPSCRWQWVRTGGGIGPHRNDLTEEHHADVPVMSSGRPID